jgi:hypothetical protein
MARAGQNPLSKVSTEPTHDFDRITSGQIFVGVAGFEFHAEVHAVRAATWGEKSCSRSSVLLFEGTDAVVFKFAARCDRDSP